MLWNSTRLVIFNCVILFCEEYRSTFPSDRDDKISCCHCDSGVKVEDETHFLFHCRKYLFISDSFLSKKGKILQIY